MYSWVVLIDRCPTSCWTSRSDPPACWMSLAARVTKVLLPEWDEHPAKPSSAKRSVNQSTIAFAVIGPPRSDLMIGDDGGSLVCCCERWSRTSDLRSSGWIGILLP